MAKLKEVLIIGGAPERPDLLQRYNARKVSTYYAEKHGEKALEVQAQSLSNWARSSVILIFVYENGSERKVRFECNYSDVHKQSIQDTLRELDRIKTKLAASGGTEFESACRLIDLALKECKYERVED